MSVLTPTPDIESVTEALRTGPYGKCVYDMDNDVMSQQVSLVGKGLRHRKFLLKH